MINKTFRILSAVVIMLCSLPGQAETKDLDIHKVCESSPSDCLSQSSSQLRHETRHSNKWFSYKLYQLESLFRLKKFETLETEIKPWLGNKDVRFMFQFSIQTYHAKILAVKGNIKQSIIETDKAFAMLGDLNDNYSSPLRVIQIANLQNYLGQYDKAIETLKIVEDRVAHRGLPWVNMELYGNLGHVYCLSERFKLCLDSRLKSVKWGEEVGIDQQLAIAQFNLGEVYLYLDEYADAEKHFKIANKIANKAGDNSNAWYSTLKLAEIQMEQRNKIAALNLLSEVDKNRLPNFLKDIYKDLQGKTLEIKNP